MELRRHDPDDAPVATGGYTNAMEVVGASRLVFVSGQVPADAGGTVPEDAEGQCRQIWANIDACLASAGLGVGDIVKVTTYLSDRSVAAANTAVRQDVLGDHRPALTVVVAGIFDEGWLLEIEVVAAS